MDNSFKYKLLKLQDKNVFDLVKDFEKKGETPLKIILSIRKLFPKLSLLEAKEIIIIEDTKAFMIFKMICLIFRKKNLK
jgi:hypothetical protein